MITGAGEEGTAPSGGDALGRDVGADFRNKTCSLAGGNRPQRAVIGVCSKMGDPENQAGKPEARDQKQSPGHGEYKNQD